MVGVPALGEIGAVGELITLLNKDMPVVERRAREELRRITAKESEGHQLGAIGGRQMKRFFNCHPRKALGPNTRLS